MLKLQEHGNESRVPVVRMDDVGPEIHRLQEVQDGAREEGEALRIVIVAVEALAVEVFFIVDEVVGHAIHDESVNADELVTPRNIERAVVKMFHLVDVFR